MRSLSFLFAIALCAPALASDLNLSITSGAATSVMVGPGGSVSYDVTGELSDAINEGLALFLCDLSFDGGPLTQASAPGADPMARFASPLGLNNPAGYGGTVVGGDLIQVGGAQNTILSTFAPQPTGMVVTSVAQPGAAQVLVSGLLTAPMTPGTYTLSLSNVVANVIKQGETGSPFWAVEPACAGSAGSLEIIVLDCGTFTFCVGAPNSDTGGASISNTGSTSIAANDLVLRVDDAKHSGFGLFFYGSTQLMAPFGDGFRCVGGAQTFRLYPPLQANPSGTATRAINYNAPPNPSAEITVGSSWNFQYWYRDIPAGGAGFNTSNGLSATFCP